ncbi:hypothetical protein GGF32_006925, partial [Allomyces javanicus]
PITVSDSDDDDANPVKGTTAATDDLTRNLPVGEIDPVKVVHEWRVQTLCFGKYRYPEPDSIRLQEGALRIVVKGGSSGTPLVWPLHPVDLEPIECFPRQKFFALRVFKTVGVTIMWMQDITTKHKLKYDRSSAHPLLHYVRVFLTDMPPNFVQLCRDARFRVKELTEEEWEETHFKPTTSMYEEPRSPPALRSASAALRPRTANLPGGRPPGPNLEIPGAFYPNRSAPASAAAVAAEARAHLQSQWQPRVVTRSTARALPPPPPLPPAKAKPLPISIDHSDDEGKIAPAPAAPRRLRSRASIAASAAAKATVVLDDDDDDEDNAPKRELDAYLASKGRERTDLLFVYPFAGSKGVTLFGNDAGVLNNSDFLNDAVLEFYLRYLVDRLDPETRQTVHLFNSFFFLRLTQSGKKKKKAGGKKAAAAAAAAPADPYVEGYQHVKSWTKNVDLFEKKMVFVPINENLHWYLAVILNPGKLVIKDEPAPPQTVNGGHAGGAAGATDAPAAATGSAAPSSSAAAASAADSTAAVVDESPTAAASASARVGSAATTPSKPSAAAIDRATAAAMTPAKPVLSQMHDAFELSPAGANDAIIVVDGENDDDEDVCSGPTPGDAASVPIPDSPPVSPLSPVSSLSSFLDSSPKNGTTELAASATAAPPRPQPQPPSMPGTTSQYFSSLTDPKPPIRRYTKNPPTTPAAKTRGAAAKETAPATPPSPVKTKRSSDEPCILLLDSLSSGRPKQKTIDALEAYLKHEAATRGYRLHPNWAKPTRGGTSPAWPHRLAAPCPQQPNSWDCGIYVLHFVERILVDADRILPLLVSTRTEAGVLLSLFHDERPPPENDPWRIDQIETKRLTLMRLILGLADEYIEYRKKHGIDDPDSTVNAMMDAADDDDDDVIMAEPADNDETDDETVAASALGKAQSKMPRTGGNKLGAAPADKWAVKARNDAATPGKTGKGGTISGKGKDTQESIQKFFAPRPPAPPALSPTGFMATHMDPQPDEAGPDDPIALATHTVPPVVPPKTNSQVSLALDDSDDAMDVDVHVHSLASPPRPQSPHVAWHRRDKDTFTSYSPVMGERLSSSPPQPVATAPPPRPLMRMIPGETTASGMVIPSLAVPDMPSPVRSDYLDVPVQQEEDAGTMRGLTPDMSAEHMHPRAPGTDRAAQRASPPRPRPQEHQGSIDLVSDSDEDERADSSDVDVDDAIVPPPVPPEAPLAAATSLVLTVTDSDARVERVGAAEASAVANTNGAGPSWWKDTLSSLLPASLTGAKPPAAAVREPATPLPPPRPPSPPPRPPSPPSRPPSHTQSRSSSSGPLPADVTARLRATSSPVGPNPRRSSPAPTARGEPAHAARARTERAESPDLGGNSTVTTTTAAAAPEALSQRAESMTIDDSDSDSDTSAEAPAPAPASVASSSTAHVAPASPAIPPPPPPTAAAPAPTDLIDMTNLSDGDDDDIFEKPPPPPPPEPRKRVRHGESRPTSPSPPALKRPRQLAKRSGGGGKSPGAGRKGGARTRSSTPPNVPITTWFAAEAAREGQGRTTRSATAARVQNQNDSSDFEEKDGKRRS